MLILPNLVDPEKVDFLHEIDKYIATQAQKLHSNIRFKFDKKINYDSLNTLYVLRDVFISKVHCADWLSDFSMDQIIKALRKELRNNNC